MASGTGTTIGSTTSGTLTTRLPFWQLSHFSPFTGEFCFDSCPFHPPNIDREIAELQGSLLNVAEKEQDPIALLEYAEGYPSIFWKKSKLHTKLKLQWFEFPSGIVFENEKFRTIKLANVFNVKTASCDTVSTSVDFDNVFVNQLIRELEYLAWVLRGDYTVK